jgi:MFS family permease
MGGGIAYIPALAVISSSFTTKRPIAIGCASIGSSIGSVAFPIMFRRLQPSIGFPWAVRTIAFIVLLLSILTCMILCRRPGKRGRARRLVEGKAFADLTFMLFSGSIILVMMAYYIPIFFVPAYARTKLGTSDDLASYMLAIVNGASTFGRTLPYLLGTRVKPIHTLFFCYVAGAIAMFSWIAVTSVAGFIVWLCYWGFLSGIVVTAPSSIVAHPILCPDMHYIGTRLGMMWGIGSLGSLVGGPICGALVNLEAAEWLHPQIFGGMVLVGAVLLQLWPTAAVLSYDRKASSGLNS